MSTLIANKLQVGQSITTENNTLITSTSDGLIISNGVDGSSTQVAKIDKFGNIVANSIVTSQGAISGDRNRVINGSCQIVNVATFVAANNTSGYGGPEMFVASNQGAGGQFTQTQGSLTWQGASLPTVRQTVNTAVAIISGGTFWRGISARLEGFNVFDLTGKPVVVSFVFNTNVSGTYSVSLRDSNPDQSYVSTFVAVANTPMQVSIPISAIPLAANLPNTNVTGLSITVGFLNTGTFQTATLNQWQSGNFISASGATNWGATAGNFIELTNLQLEEGSVATPFIRRSYGVELALTQRYYEAGVYNWTMYQLAENGFTTVQSFSVIKRAIPTITTSDVVVVNVTNAGVSANVSGIIQTGTATATGVVVHGGSFAASARL